MQTRTFCAIRYFFFQKKKLIIVDRQLKKKKQYGKEFTIFIVFQLCGVFFFVFFNKSDFCLATPALCVSVLVFGVCWEGEKCVSVSLHGCYMCEFNRQVVMRQTVLRWSS